MVHLAKGVPAESLTQPGNVHRGPVSKAHPATKSVRPLHCCSEPSNSSPPCPWPCLSSSSFHLLLMALPICLPSCLQIRLALHHPHDKLPVSDDSPGAPDGLLSFPFVPWSCCPVAVNSHSSLLPGLFAPLLRPPPHAHIYTCSHLHTHIPSLAGNLPYFNSNVSLSFPSLSCAQPSVSAPELMPRCSHPGASQPSRTAFVHV